MIPTEKHHPFELRQRPLSLVPAAASVALLLVCAAQAGDILRGGAASNAPAPRASFGTNGAAAAQARSNAQDALARTQQALQSVRSAQAAARAAAVGSGATNLGADPNHPGLQLPNVPDGLGVGGLEFTSATGASAPTQSGNTVTVRQNVQQALLDWKTFNVGSKTTLHFDQTAGGLDVGQWIAFNRVTDPTGVPSQILGSIQAEGQVYIINQNGIIFGGGSQVNVHALVASSLPVNSGLLKRGLLNNPDAQFLFSALPQTAGSKGPTDAFTPPSPGPPNGRYGDVTVQPGAQLSAPTTAEHVGGRVALLGANVHNAGTISTPDGQTILAAGLQVGFDAHSTSDPSLRGLDVYVGQVVDPASALAPYAGTATNSGLIESLRGNVTITGKNVNQLGAINSSTSVSLNGRIDLLANYGALRNANYNPVSSSVPPFLYRNVGNVTLGPDSVTQILPEWGGTERVIGTQLALRSQVNIQGGSIYLAPKATILAPNATVNLNAGVWDYVQEAATSNSTFVNSGGQIYLDRNALISAAGSTNVSSSLAQSILTVTLRGAEFADSPLQRTSIFRPGDGSNPSITVDLRKTGTYNGRTWYGTPLADLSGYLGLILRTVDELTVAGGSVNLNSGGSVVVQPGAKVDVSGGFINYTGGFVKTTRVLYAGHLIDMADATPDRLYQGIFTGLFTESHPRWGVTNTYKIPWMDGAHYEQPYTAGANGGALAVSAPAMALDGDFLGNTVPGPRQRGNPPTPSSLTLDFEAQQLFTPYPKFSPNPPEVTFDTGHLAPADAFALDAGGKPLPLREDRVASVILNPDLLKERGFGTLTLTNPNGNITVPRNIALSAPPKGAITMSGANISVLGSITAPGGKVTLTTYNLSPYDAVKVIGDPTAVLPPPDPNRGTFTLGQGATINTAGLIVDDRMSAPSPGSLPLITAGGSVAITAYNADLERNSLIDVSGGVRVSPTGQRTYGDAGSISIIAGQDTTLKSVLGGHLKLGGRLIGYSGAKGGALTLQAPVIQIGGRSPALDALLLKPEFFSEGGFSSFTLIGLGESITVPGGLGDEVIPGVSVAPGTVIEPKAQSYVAVPHQWGTQTVTMVPVLKPEGLRTPVNITLSAPGVIDDPTGLLKVRGDVVIGARSRIQTDALGSLALNGNTVAVFGSLIAPGGTITIAGSSNSINTFPNRAEAQSQALVTVYLAAGSKLSTAGKTVLLPDRWGHRTGYVLPGGTISVSGNILAEAGATLDVSGANGVLDLPPAYLGRYTPMNAPLLGSTLVPVTSGVNSPLYAAFTLPLRVDSNAGTILLKGGQELFTAANLVGKAGGPTALGGNLSISSGRFYDVATQPQDKKPSDVTLTVSQSKIGFAPGGLYGIGRPVLDSSGSVIGGQGFFAVDHFNRGGFDALSLGGTLQFSGPVNINARRAIIAGIPSSSSALDGGVIFADSVVNLTAPYVALGKPFQTPVQLVDKQSVVPFKDGLGQIFLLAPTFGTGKLNVSASLIDIGNLSLQGIGEANLIADHGDIRGNGTFDIAGKLYLRAGQIYPTTAGRFTIASYDYIEGGIVKPGTVTIAGSGARQLPLSAGGTLSVYGSVITQGGTLRSPIGAINLGWDGTGTGPKDDITGAVVPLTQNLTLTAGSVTSVSAVDPLTGKGIVIPFGVNPLGTAWIDPTGLDITAGGAPAKTINLGAQNLVTQAGSLIDIRGGGDLYAYQWIKGNGGSKDILASSSSFAVIPGYEANFSPFAPFSTSGTGTTNLNGNPGYVNTTLGVGDRVFLEPSRGLSSGVYTLLPARYALLPGAFLVTPQSGTPIGKFNMPDGSTLVDGYRFNDLNSARSVPGIFSRFEVASGDVVRQRSEYKDFFANTFLRESALKLDQKVPRLPIDGGYLLLSASSAMTVQGQVFAKGATGGRGGLVDISSPVDIVITGPGISAPPGALSLDSALLSSYGADSLLIGGSRTFGSGGTTVNVRTNNVAVNNAGMPLSAPEIILVANQNLSLAPGATIRQSGALADAADLLLLGDPNVPGSGDGTLLRVSSDMSAQIVRQGVSNSNVPNMTIGAGAVLSGASLILDSTARTTLDPTATLDGKAVSLNSGRISMQLTSPGALQLNPGLVLAGNALQSLTAAQSLSLLSYSSIDVYGTGGFSTAGTLALHAAELRGFNTAGGTVTFTAPTILLDNSPGRPAPGPTDPVDPASKLVFNANVITIGTGQFNVDQFGTVVLSAPGGILMQGAGGLAAQSALLVNAPVVTGAKNSTQTLTAGTTLDLVKPPGSTAQVTGGLGASLNIVGGTVNIGSDIVLPSGALTARATSGALTVTSLLDVSGSAQTFFDQTRYTDAGQISLFSTTGNVNIAAGSLLNVSAHAEGGNAGRITISAPLGAFNLAGAMAGTGGAGGSNGVFSLDVLNLPAYATINNTLNAANFTESRNIRVRTGDVALIGTTKAKTFSLSADKGSITLANVIDASGATGGTVSLTAWKSVVLQNGSQITVAAQNFNSAGKGGTVFLEAGSAVFNGGTYAGGAGAVLNLQTGSSIDLGVAANTPGSAALGQLTGTLRLRAPQNAASTNLAVNPINGTITGASAITVEGYKIFTPAGGNITTAVQNSIRTTLNIFGGNLTTITNNLFLNNAALKPIAVVMPGAEVINRTGDLTLGATNSLQSVDWNLATFRFGTKKAPGVLTLRAAGNINLFNTIQDGFDVTNVNSAYNASLLSPNGALPANVQSWSYRLTSGADFTAADIHRVQTVAALDLAFPNKGSLQLGKNGGSNNATAPGAGATTSSALNAGIGGRFQVIRTGTGDIDITAGRDVQLLNQFASIYSAGALIDDPTLGGTFDTPSPSMLFTALGNLGAVQQSNPYPAQYTLAGGNVSISAGNDILHQTRNVSNVLIPDSERELPMNWLDRRGYVDPATGLFGVSHFGEVASTSWWVDFSNFFEGVGALGGGNVTLNAGRDVTNVDGLVPTNARMAGRSGGVAIAPNAANMTEIGGGDLVVRAGRNIDGGVYYIERGAASLNAGGSITTNATRTPSLGILKNPADILTKETWLPTTLFLGKGGFDVKARGDALLGPVVNPFLLPQGYNNSYWYKTWFSTFAPTDYVNVTSLGGTVTLRESVTLPSAGDTGVSTPTLLAFMQREHQLVTQSGPSQSASNFHPWLRLTEDNLNGFDSVMTLMPSTLRATAFSGDINLVGSINLSPSSTGTADMLAAGAFNALQINGRFIINGAPVNVWISGRINLSDADPASVPGVASPFAYHSLVRNVASRANSSTSSTLGLKFLKGIDVLLAETGSTTGAAAVVQTKQALHAAGLLHTGDTQPLRIYAAGGDISGLTLFSAKQSRIISGHDISDIAFYLQNVSGNDVSVVSSGRDVVAYNASTPLRVAARSTGNGLSGSDSIKAGDIQINGPGTIEVLAGRHLDLGVGPNNSDGTGLGLISIGNGRNPYLPFEGASIIAAAGLGSAGGLENSKLDLDSFIAQFVTGGEGARYFSEMPATTTGTAVTQASFSALSKAEQNRIALEIFYLVLRDAGRDHNLAGSSGFGTYTAATTAISTLFPGTYTGDISLTAREIKTKSGGDISILAPGGKLTVGLDANGTQPLDQGILTEHGGSINIFTKGNVDLGTSRVFTLRGGDIIMFSSEGNIAAGASSKTVQSAPPTRVLIDPQSGDVKVDLAGLATGGGIGVLATVTGVPPGNVDLIAPLGVVDAGDAGIRATGNLTIAATAVLNASNIAVGGATTGTPAAIVVSAPNVGGITGAQNTAGQGANTASEMAKQARGQEQIPQDTPSIITVEVLGYGGGEEEEDEETRRKRRQPAAL